MNAMNSSIAASAVQVAGWTLVHFIWQGSAIALAAGAALRLLARRSASARYLAASAALVAMMAAPIATANLIWPSTPAAEVTVEPSIATMLTGAFEAVGPMPGAASRGHRTRRRAVRLCARLRRERRMPAVVGLWLFGVALLLGRMVGGWLQVRRLHGRALASAPSKWQAAADRLAARMRLAAVVRVVESALVDVPTVVGWLRPAVILPVAAIASLSPAQVEAVLAHELAHVRRHDYLVNLFQTLAETLLFYHPAVWWLSRAFASSASTAATTWRWTCRATRWLTRAPWPSSRYGASARRAWRSPRPTDRSSIACVASCACR